MKRNPWKLAFLSLAAGVLATSITLYGVPTFKSLATEGEQDQIVPSEMALNPTTNSNVSQSVKPIEDVPKDQSLPEDMKNEKDGGIPKLTEPRVKSHKLAGTKKAKLVVHVIDGRTGKPIQGADTVLVETGERFKSDATGTTPSIDAPVIREERYEDQVAALHGQLGLVTYKNGYRDSITFGVRMHEGTVTDVTVWMYQITPSDRRIEPVFYHEPYHHLWLVQLADTFRSPSQPGEGQESPNR
ncbi:MAG: hypothetical protein ACXVDB_07015 [Tumebacillaceae bacterium]